MIKLIANLLIIFLLFIPKVSAIEELALPTGPQVTEGEVTINNQISGTLNINQISSSATIEWTTFNVGSKASVYFNQPTNTSSIYNDVRSGRSIINGKIYANGKLFLHNPSGIYLGPYSAVQGQGIVLSTLNLLNKNSQTQEHFYASQSDANLETQGLIEAGYVTLISSSIKQLGTIKATGDVQLAASDEVYLKILPNSQLTVKVEPSEIQTALDNQGGIISSQGQVFLKSDIAQSFVDQSINHSNLQATELVNDNGIFKLVSNSGNIKANNIQLSSGKRGATSNSGVLDASTDFDGGIISIEGNQISIQENSILNATGKNQGGQIKIGGDWQGQGSMIQAETTSIDKNTTINASSLGEGDGGTIVVWSDIKNPSSVTSVKGDLIASAINGQGGNIETSGYHLDISSVNINASSDQGADGLWLIDPVDFTIASSGGDMTGSALTTSLASQSVTILSSDGSSGTEGDININDAVTWSANKLTLNANNNIYINADLLGSGTAQLDLLYGQGAVASGNTSDYSILKTSSADSTSFSAQVTLADGNNFSTTLGSDGSAINYQVISDLSSLTDANVNYALGSDIDATARASSQYVLSGSNSTIDGLGHTIDGLTLAWTNANGTGFVGNSGSGFAIKNLGLTNINYSHSLGRDTRWLWELSLALVALNAI
jgi:filamentous hemagglutinin family protein